jgi:hypothetical protein
MLELASSNDRLLARGNGEAGDQNVIIYKKKLGLPFSPIYVATSPISKYYNIHIY